jgi:beta-glucosidase
MTNGTYQFPKDFLWGVSTSAYQIEGAYNEDGKGASIWDQFVKIPGKIIDSTNGNIACDHYHRYESDIELLHQLGIQIYRFSVAWSRILPAGIGKPNQKGIDFYHRLLDNLLRYNIQPMLTMYHWDLPEALFQKGGFTSPEYNDWFLEYANTLITAFSDKVNYIVTYNQPFSIAFGGYYNQKRAPGICDLDLAIKAMANLLSSHGKCVKMFKELSRKNIGIILNLMQIESASTSQPDYESARLQDGIINRIFIDPLFKGSFPGDVLRYFTKQNADITPLLAIDPKELMQKGDFMGINYYTRRVIQNTADQDWAAKEVHLENAVYSDGGREVYPEGLYNQIQRISRLEPKLPLFITENGADYRDDTLEDYQRIAYHQSHIKIIARLCRENVNLKGYLLWTLMDNFEWENGYCGKYGLFSIAKNLDRVAKHSAKWYKKLIRENSIEL